MRFINRQEEIKELENALRLSKRKLFSLVMYGLRRVGKTRLIEEFIKNKDALYFFVYESKTSFELLKEFEKELKEKGILKDLEEIKDWYDFVRILFERGKNKIIVFDEFQNFLLVDRSVYSIFQRSIDKFEQSKGLFIIFLGSTLGLIKKVFENKKAALFGRVKTKIRLNELSLSNVHSMLMSLKYKDFDETIKFYSIFGGYPKYYVAIEDFGLEGNDFLSVIRFFFLRDNAPFIDEVETILKLEFGKRKSTYYSILSAIADGKTKLNEIATAINKKITSITRQLDELVNVFELVKRETTVFNEKKKTLYKIRHPLIDFWFKFVYRNYSKFQLKDYDFIYSLIKDNINSVIGKRFEDACKEYFFGNRPISFTSIGKWWGHYRDENNKRKEIEIDIVALNENTREIFFAECKWQEKINAEKIFSELKEKAKYVQWHNEKRKEHYAIFAKSFSKKLANCFDLRDIEKIFK